MARMSTRLRLVGAAALVASTVSLATAATPGTATAATTKVLAGSVLRHLPPGAKVLGALPATRRIGFEVVLAFHDPARLAALVASQYDARSASFHRFLTPAAFASRFGATSSEVGAVTGWLRAQGITPGALSANRLVLSASAPSGTLASVLHTRFALISTSTGRLAYANRTAPVVPASIATSVVGIVGLDDLSTAHTSMVRLHRVAAGHRALRSAPRASAKMGLGPVACSYAATAAFNNGSFTASGIARYYGMTPLYGLGDAGQGVRVAIEEFEPFSSADIEKFQACYGTHAQVRAHDVVSSPGSGPGSGESALDIENVIGAAPRASVDVFQTGTNSDASQVELLTRMVDSGDKVISTSWGSCEPETTYSVMLAEHNLLLQSQAQGQVMFAAAGDGGATDCYPNAATTSDNWLVTVDDPASQPYVVGVGGTSATGAGEVVWNDGGGAGGGGLSSVECMPGYQDNVAVPGLINAYSSKNTSSCPVAPSYARQVPDVTAVADPATGYTVIVGNSWGAIGGTSGAAPLWAGAAALVLASPYCRSLGATAGVTAESLYALAATHFRSQGLRDVTSGDNAVPAAFAGDASPPPVEGYPAAPGYDLASGLGSPSLTARSTSRAGDLFHAGLASLLCYDAAPPGPATVRTVVPDRVASNRPTRVAITGTGFFPVAGADHVVIDGRVLVASCSSRTRCTVVLPGLPATTANLRVQVQTIATSPAVPSDLVTFVAAPTLVAMSAHAGAPGARLVLRGSGFSGQLGVKFGIWSARILRRVSASELVVVVPPGAGDVYVTVRAVGGATVLRPAGLFRF